MTTPGGSAPDDSFVLGSTYGSDLTESSAKAIMKSPVTGSYANAQTMFHGAIENFIDSGGAEYIADAITLGAFTLLAQQVARIPVVGGALSEIAMQVGQAIADVDIVAQTAQETGDTAQVTGDNAQTTANNAQTAIDELTAAVSGEVDAGETVTFTFTGADGAALDGNWTDLVAGMVVRGSTAGIDSGAGNTARPAVICGTAFTGNGQEVSVVLGSTVYSDQVTWILFGMNSTGTVAVAAEPRGNGCALRRITRSGSTWTVAQTWATGGTGFNNGDRVTIGRRRDENIYRMLRNGAPVITYTDSGNTHPRDSAYWRAGFREERTLDPFGIRSYDSARINSVRLTDYGTAAAVTGTGWRVSRLSTATSSTTSWSTTGAALNCYDNTDYAIGGVSVASQAAGRVTVPATGWYLLTAGVDGLSSALTDRGLGVSAGPSGAQTLQPGRLCQGSSGGETLGIYGSKMCFLQSGWQVNPVGITRTGSASVGVRGDAGGMLTYFEGTLVRSM